MPRLHQALFQPRRSVLYVPAINERALAKAATLDCDCVILDLEDAIAPEHKVEARTKACAALESGIFKTLSGGKAREVIIRVNGFAEDSDLVAEDLAAILPYGPDAILFPKINGAADAHRAEAALDSQAAPVSVALWLMIETPRAILEIGAIAAEAARDNSRLAAFVMGTSDLAKDMRLALTGSRLALLHALSASVTAARAYDLAIFDGVFGTLDDDAGFDAECRQGKGLGFDGKTLIHPRQIEPANRLFSPSEVERAEARAIIAAFEDPANAGKGVLTINGRMAERLHYEIARQVIGIA